MSVDVGIVITDYDWVERSRPIVTIDERRETATVQIGNGEDIHPIHFEIVGNNTDDLVSQLRGLSEIFAKAAEVSATSSDTSKEAT